MRFEFGPAIFALGLASPALAAPVNIDLSPWVGNGGTWARSVDNNSVTQSINSPTIVFHSNENDIGTQFRGSFEVETAADDDFVGFVLGYTNNDISQTGPDNSNINYLLIDWKQQGQVGWSEGMSASLITGNIWADGGGTAATGSDAWQHTGDVSLITRSNAAGANYANTGWADNTLYDFVIDYTADRIRVEIDGQVEFDLQAWQAGLDAFSEGSFGFYGFSQENVRYSALQEQASTLLPAPVPAALPLMAGGIGALSLVARRRVTATPDAP